MTHRLCCEGNSEEAAYRQKRTHSSTLADFWGLISPQHFDDMPTIRSSGFPPRNAPNSIRRPWRVSQDRSGETSSSKTFRELLFNVSIDRGFLCQRVSLA